MKYEIKKATLDDVVSIKKIEDECFSVPWSENSLEECLNNPCSHFYLAKAENEALGYIGIQIFSDEGYVTNVATLPEYRKQGIAKALVKRALENDMEFLTLEVRKSNLPAISLYKKLGFTVLGEQVGAYRTVEDGKTVGYENALVMGKKLI